jgi:hypothetical protein
MGGTQSGTIICFAKSDPLTVLPGISEGPGPLIQAMSEASEGSIPYNNLPDKGSGPPINNAGPPAARWTRRTVLDLRQ